jgi:hypothetical protein
VWTRQRRRFSAALLRVNNGATNGATDRPVVLDAHSTASASSATSLAVGPRYGILARHAGYQADGFGMDTTQFWVQLPASF